MKASSLILSDDALQGMIRDAEREYPNECCGFLFGLEKDDKRQISEILSVENIRERKTRRFEISPFDYNRAERHAIEHELTLLGKKAFPGTGVTRDQEVSALKRELAQVKKERDFLKEAAAYFAKQSK